MRAANLAWANIKRGKSAAISLFILIFIASLLLNIGITVISTLNAFYDDKAEKLHDPHVVIMMSNAAYKQADLDFLKTYKGVDATEAESILLMSAAKFRFGDNTISLAAALLNADTARTMGSLKYVEALSDHSGDIVVPYSLKANSGYKLGDPFTIAYGDTNYSFRIGGFFETTMLGTNDSGAMKFFLTDSAYRQLSAKLGEQAAGTLLSARLTDSSQSTKMLHDYDEQFPRTNQNQGDAASFFWRTSIETMKSVGTLTSSIVAAILVAFAAVIVVVSLIVIKFRVTNSIEDGMVNIGILQSLGYTSREILASMTTQYLSIVLVASFAGIASSYAAMPVFGGIISSLSGLVWTQSLNVLIDLTSILIIAVLVLTVTLLSGFRIRKLHPVEALRGGRTAHSFKRNYFPLEKTKGSLHAALAFKNILINSKQTLMIALIFVAVTFASIFSIVLYYNVATDKTAFVHLVGAETSNVMVQAKLGTDSKELFGGIEAMPGVDRVALMDVQLMKLDGQAIYMNIVDDFSKLDNHTVFEGREPRFDNEIAVSWTVAKVLHKKIGDTVNVEVAQTSHSFLITGLSQSISNMSQTASITLTGAQHLLPSYEGNVLNVYLKKGTDNSGFIASVKAHYGEQMANITNIDEMINGQSSIYISAVFAVMLLILGITVLVIALILYMVIKTMILKRRRELGILKALGYTTLQLMTQITMSFVPIVIVGVVVGGVLGCLYTNSVLTLLLSGAGIHNVQFTVHLPSVLVLGALLIALAYLVSMLVSYRINKITAYGLITE